MRCNAETCLYSLFVCCVVVICVGELDRGSSSALSLSECVERLRHQFTLQSTTFKDVLDEVLGILGDDSLTASCAQETKMLPKARKIVAYCRLNAEGVVVVAEGESKV